MTKDLFHNKIIKDNMTDAFVERIDSELVPLLSEKYGDSLLGIQMYEDCLDLGFLLDGEFYYPLTLVMKTGVKREWIKWNAQGKRRFADNVPFAFIADGEIGFSIVEKSPEGFEEKLAGHATYFEGDKVAFKIDTPVSNKTLLVGKYSQTFIDEMTRQLTDVIESAFSVKGLSESGVELVFMFAPDTYMEHRVENVTYKRLLISARACGARDLWIKWTRLDGGIPYTVTDNVTSDNIKFELGEDVSQKIREKEYRFLISTSAEKYQAAMGRRNITEWRDMIKRVIKRGELTKVDVVEEDPIRMGELADKLKEVVSDYSAPARATETTDNSDINALLRSVIGGDKAAEPEATETVEAKTTDEATADDLPWETEDANVKTDTTTEASFASEDIEASDEPAIAPGIDEAELRRRIEAEIRAELEKEALKKATDEAEELRRAHERLKAEKEELESRAREAEEKLRKEAEAIAENERLRAELSSLQRAEAREKELMAEAARLAIDEQKRIEAERDTEEARAAEEAAKLAGQEAILAAKRAEEERLAEAQRAAEEEKKAAEAAALAEAEKKQAEEAAKKEAEAEKPAYTYVSKNVRLLFKYPVDPNITKRIHEIILSAIKYFHKEHVYMKIKPSIPDPTTVNLHFVKFPEEENDFLVDMIKVLGKSEIGITKAFLE